MEVSKTGEILELIKPLFFLQQELHNELLRAKYIFKTLVIELTFIDCAFPYLVDSSVTREIDVFLSTFLSDVFFWEGF